eukprot:354169-Chlamydomonas_euryale.AAC.34
MLCNRSHGRRTDVQSTYLRQHGQQYALVDGWAGWLGSGHEGKEKRHSFGQPGIPLATTTTTGP